MTKRPETAPPYRSLSVVCGAVLMAACAGGLDPETAPTPFPDDSVVSGAIAVVGQSFTNDSAADAHALAELRDLEFRSHGKAGNRAGVTLSQDLSKYLSSPPSDVRRPVAGGAAAQGSYGLDIESYLNHDRVQYYIDYFVGPSRERFDIWLSRMGRWEGMIRDRFARYGLPEDLVYLALIESGYSATAVSRARAVGMWQFMSFTGRRYGLRIDDWVDERRDPYKATDAAARYLADLKDQFGAWYLAAAAYNGGAGRVSRGLERLANQSQSDDAFFALADSRYIFRETRDYVPKLIAATSIARAPEAHGFALNGRFTPLVFDEIVVAEQTGLDVFAELADTTTGALVELNPQFYRGATPPNERVTVRVPRGRGPAVLARYLELPASERINFVEHVVRRGETLGEIAARYGASLSNIQSANPRVQPRRLAVGHRLVIPLSQAARRDPSRSTQRSVTPVAPPSHGMHAVRLGESLWVISQRYGLTIQQLRDWNGIADGGSKLAVGERLRVAPPSR